MMMFNKVHNLKHHRTTDGKITKHACGPESVRGVLVKKDGTIRIEIGQKGNSFTADVRLDTEDVMRLFAAMLKRRMEPF